MHNHVIPVPKGHHEVYLKPGELVFAQSPCLIRTVLGSCVGVSLYDPRLAIGGMCHYLLSQHRQGDASSRFGDVALPTLIRKFIKAGSHPADLEACVAGGSLMLDLNEVFFVGEKNIQVADSILAEYRIRVKTREVGGDRGRRMSLDSESGNVAISLIPETGMEMKNIF